MKIGIITFVLGVILSLLRLTVRFRFKPSDPFENELSQVILASLHGQQLLLLALKPRTDIQAAVSQSRDGDIAARLIESHGYSTARGSSSEGGKNITHALVAHLRSGGNGCITVDGPRGPRGIVKPGIIKIAHLTGAAIMPIVFTCSRSIKLNSWDRFEIPLPFATIWVHHAKLWTIPKKLEDGQFEQNRRKLEEQLATLTGDSKQ